MARLPRFLGRTLPLARPTLHTGTLRVALSPETFGRRFAARIGPASFIVPDSLAFHDRPLIGEVQFPKFVVRPRSIFGRDPFRVVIEGRIEARESGGTNIEYSLRPAWEAIVPACLMFPLFVAFTAWLTPLAVVVPVLGLGLWWLAVKERARKALRVFEEVVRSLEPHADASVPAKERSGSAEGMPSRVEG